MDKYEYQYDSAGNQTSKTEKIDGTVKGTIYYTYDELNRLESVTEPDDRCTEYTYDKSGNRAMKTVINKVTLSQDNSKK